MDRRTSDSRALSTELTVPQWSERVWMALIGGLLLNSILRGIRPPNMWAYTHFLGNYDFGFAKRSLQGAVVSALNIPAAHIYSFAFSYMMIVFVANVLLLLWFMRRLSATGDLTTRLTASVFASSLAIVVLAHIVGYGDQVGLLVTLLALAARRFYHRCVLVAVLFPISILIQETEFVIFFPLILFRFLIDLGSFATVQRRKLLAVLFVCMCVFTTLLVVGNTHMSEAAANAMYQSIQSKAEWPLRAYRVTLTTTFADNLREVSRAYGFPFFQRFLLLSWVATLPTTIYLIHRTWSHMQRKGDAIYLRVAAVCASVAPLTVHIIAWDANRFAAFALLTSFLVYVTVALQGNSANASAPPLKSSLILPITLIGMNLTSSIPLFDGYEVRSFPYTELLYSLTRTLTLKEQFPPHPEQCSGKDGCYFINNGDVPQSGLSKAEFCSKTP